MKCETSCDYRESCGGSCHASGGKPFYLKDFGVDVCPIYDCAVNKNGFKTCAPCAELPCKLIYDWKDPSMSAEEHKQAVDSNAEVLRNSINQGG